MIPVSLKLSNFTSYGEDVPFLDFSKFKMVAISGQNGAGKSSLLDAITWCLWGVSRLGDSSDQLIRLGQNKMWVEFSFELDDHFFTVRRNRLLKSGGLTSLEFTSSLKDSPKTYNLTEGTIKSTQQKIIDLLHLSYETFVNSAFLRQGHADEFTTKGPSDRKRILADILGLAHYDLLEEKAREKSKETQNKLQLLEYQLLEIEAELSQKEQREKSLAEAETEAKNTEQQLKEVEAFIKTVEMERENLSLKMKSLEQSQIRIETAQKELAELKTQIDLKERAKKDYQEILEQRLEIVKNYQKLQKLQDRRKTLETERTQLIKVKDELAALQQIINERNEKRNKAIADLEIQKKQLETVKTQLEIQNKQLLEQKDLCPTCGQTIGQHKNQEIIAKNTDQIDKNKQQITNLIEKIKKYQAYVFEEQAQATKKEIQAKQIEETTQDYKEVFEQIDLLSRYEALNSKLQQADVAVKSHQETIVDLQKIYQDKQSKIATESKDLLELNIFEKQFQEVKIRLQAEEEVKLQLTDQTLVLRGKVGEAKQLVSRSKQLEDFAEQKRQDKTRLQKEKEIYDELSLAFGKKGIQAMIIETAIPEIEDEANRLLDKLTEGRMRVKLETQKETKNKMAGGEKGVIETLDIIISDEMGERPYEGYSVDGNELVYIRQNGKIKVLPIKDLWSEAESIKIDGEYQLQKSDCEALCYVNGRAVWQKVDKILRHQSPEKILEVTARPGNHQVNLTRNHSLYILTPDGLKVTRTEDLKPGDFILTPKIIPELAAVKRIDFLNYISENFIQKRISKQKTLKFDDEFLWSRLDQRINRFIELNQNFAELLGLAVAEGSGEVSYSMAAGSNLDLAQKVTFLASQAFGTPQRVLGYISKKKMTQYIQKTPGVSSIYPKAQYRPMIGGRLIAEIMKNMVGKKARFKKIPDFIFNSNSEIKIAFLQGLILGDGHFSVYKKFSKSSINITTTSKRLTGELVFLCRQLGIFARIENHGEAGFRRNMYHQKSYRVVVSGKKNLEILGLGEVVTNYNTAVKYEGIPCSLIGIHRKNNQRFPRYIENKRFDCGIRILPQNATGKYQKIQKIVKDWNILKVKSVKEIKAVSDYVYDLMVPGNNSFVAGNGAILVHNSGGEQFRVNFAIRLALSKLLTHRAGAKLQFLVIDEGFGTQDAQGRARIIEALEIIKDDFAKMLIITHLEELKEEFPVRIEVQKGFAGSSFQMVGI